MSDAIQDVVLRPSHHINCILSRFQILSSSPDNARTRDTELSTTTPASFNNFMASNPSEGAKSFLDLPQELRLQIYGLLLVHHGDLYFHPAYSFYHYTHKLYPHILQTCRAIYAEGVPVLYSENKLVIDSARSMSKLQEMLLNRPSLLCPEESVRHIRSLSILGWSPLLGFLNEVETAAFQLPQLRSLSIELDDIIVSQYVAPLQVGMMFPRVTPYVLREIRRAVMRSFYTITTDRLRLRRVGEVHYEQRGVKVRTVGPPPLRLLSLTGLEGDGEAVSTTVHSMHDWSASLRTTGLLYQSLASLELMESDDLDHTDGGS